jgi:DNA-binding winged helix-turn-helix (wHTH) protein
MNPNFDSVVDPAMEPDFLRDFPNTARYVRFGPFHIDQNRQQVSRNGVRLRLQGKVYQVLIVLLHKQGEVVTREELKQALWPADTHVNYDANVNTTVNKLRQALGESTEKPSYIETIPRKGYSFISTAEFSATPFPATAPEKSQGSESAGDASVQKAPQAGSQQSSRWLTLIVVALILAGILLGAGAASYWISHFAPQFRHSSAQESPSVQSCAAFPS